MEWADDGIILGTRRHGETSLIVEALTPARGRHLGIVKGGRSRRMRGTLQPGNRVRLVWRARLEDHIGTYQVEPLRSRAAAVMGSRLALAGLNAVAALLSFWLPEREAHARLYARTEPLMDLLGQDELWPLAYLRWELALLDEMGFGLDLSRCAVTGGREGLIYVSPKSGRAVSQAGAGDWADRLLPLPRAMLGQGDAPDEEIAQGFETTGFFLRHKLAGDLMHKPLPEARQRFVDLFTRRTGRG